MSLKVFAFILSRALVAGALITPGVSIGIPQKKEYNFVKRFGIASESCGPIHSQNETSSNLIEQVDQVKAEVAQLSQSSGLYFDTWPDIVLLDVIRERLHSNPNTLWIAKQGGLFRSWPSVLGRITKIEFLSRKDMDDPFPLPGYKVTLDVLGAKDGEPSSLELEFGPYSVVASFIPISEEAARLELRKRESAFPPR